MVFFPGFCIIFCNQYSLGILFFCLSLSLSFCLKYRLDTKVAN